MGGDLCAVQEGAAARRKLVGKEYVCSIAIRLPAVYNESVVKRKVLGRTEIMAQHTHPGGCGHIQGSGDDKRLMTAIFGEECPECASNRRLVAPEGPCTCYVRHLREDVQFGLHYGAHNPTCPLYRVSRDPVDRANDDDFRREVEILPPAIANVRIW